MNNNSFVSSAKDLVTTHDARRKFFLEHALRKSEESEIYINQAKALKVVLESKTKTAQDIINLDSLRSSLLNACGVSNKAQEHLSDADKISILNSFIDKVLAPHQEKYIDEVVYRYLLSSGDKLGGKMRNIIGKLGQAKLTQAIVAQLQITKTSFIYRTDNDKKAENGSSEQPEPHTCELIKSIYWKNNREEHRILTYNRKVPQVGEKGNNVDIVLIKSDTLSLKKKDIKDALQEKSKYVLMGELKGGIDPAGADEHWKTAQAALDRIRNDFDQSFPLIFIGAAIEESMSQEIFSDYSNNKLVNCANLTSDNQLASLCEWLIQQ